MYSCGGADADALGPSSARLGTSELNEELDSREFSPQWPAGSSPLGHFERDEGNEPWGVAQRMANWPSPSCSSLGATEDGEVACPELLVFGSDFAPSGDGWARLDSLDPPGSRLPAPSGRSSPTISLSSASSSAGADASDTSELQSKRRRNAEAAARYRSKKKVSIEGIEARHAELAENHLRLQREHDRLHALNRALESQLAFFRGLFKTSASSDRLPSIHVAAAADEPPRDGTEDETLALDELMPCGSKRRVPAVPCLAVVILLVSTIGSEDLLDSTSVRVDDFTSVRVDAPRRPPGRTLLSLNEQHDSPHQCCSNSGLSLLELFFLGKRKVLDSPFSGIHSQKYPLETS
jgi:hypothetical protein